MTPGDLYDESREAYDLLAKDYGLQEGTEQIDEELLDLFLKYLGPGSTVLDLGSGPGHYARRLVALGHKVVAVDNSPGMIAELRRRGAPDGLDARCMDMRELDFEPRSFDAVLAVASLIHLKEEDLPPVLKTLQAVLRPDGVMLATFAISDKGVRFERKSANAYASSGRFFQHFPSPDVPLAHLRAAGFQLVERYDRTVEPILSDGSRGRSDWTSLLVQR